MNENLQKLMRCPVCGCDADTLRHLPCSHKLCLTCTDSLSSAETYNCPTCDKAHLIPNGGFSELPKSLLHQKVSEAAKENKQVLAKDVFLSHLKSKMADEIKLGERWREKAIKTIERETKLLETLATGLRTAREAIRDYSNTISLKCKEKIEAMTSSLMKRAADIVGVSEDGEGDAAEYVCLSYQIPEDMDGFITGNVTHLSVGILTGIENGKPIVIFPEKNYWVGPSIASVTKSSTRPDMPYIGDIVRIKPSLQKLKFGKSRPKVNRSRGVFKGIDLERSATENDLVVVIEFPEVKKWIGLYSEIEFAPGYKKIKHAEESKADTETISDSMEHAQVRICEMEKAIKEFEKHIKIRCVTKLATEKKSTESTEAEMKAYLNEIKGYQKAVGDALDGVSAIMEKASADPKISEALLCEAEEKLFLLQTLNIQARSIAFGIDSADEWRTGDCMKVVQYDKQSMKLGHYVQGGTTIGSIGLFIGQKSENIADPVNPSETKNNLLQIVMYADGSCWQVPAGLTYKVSTNRKSPYIGDRVQVKQECWEKNKGTIKLRKGELMALDIQNGLMLAVLQSKDELLQVLPYSDVEFVPGCGLEIGDEVTISKSIMEPSRGTGSVSRSSVGQIVDISGAEGDEVITVDFPECNGWVGVSYDVQLLRSPREKDEVQVKLTVTEPKHGWRGLDRRHENVGFLHTLNKDGSCEVASYESKEHNWSCQLDELELARYQRPHYDSGVSQSQRGSDFVQPEELAQFLHTN